MHRNAGKKDALGDNRYMEEEIRPVVFALGNAYQIALAASDRQVRMQAKVGIPACGAWKGTATSQQPSSPYSSGK